MSKSPNASEDRSFHQMSLYGSIEWAALRLGMSKDRFFRSRDTLEKEGFPCRDPLTNLYLKADIDAWVGSRAQFKGDDQTRHDNPNSEKRENLDAF